MRTFLKKVLALVLVVATLMGLGLSASAKVFTDDTKIVNKQAVEVMSATGVIDGMPDGSFNPEGNVTRAQMTKIVAAVLNGGEDIGNLYASANVFSDCTNHWAKSYIAYASNLKIVSGVGAGKFNPEGNVTGVAAAKMLLVALGYDPAIEVYTGADWVANVMADAKDAGLLKGMPKNFDFSKPLSRDNAALMAFNALSADMVEYLEKGTDISIGDTNINIGASKATGKTTTESWGKDLYSDGAVGSKNDPYTVQMGEQCFENLNRSDSSDAFGRPSSKWVYERQNIGNYADSPTLTYTEEVKGGTIYNDLNKPTFVAGSPDNDRVTWAIDGNATTNEITYIVANGTKVYGGQGAVTEVYHNINTNDVTITTVNVYLGQVNSFTAAKDKDAAYINVSTTNGSKPAASSLTDSGKFETNAYTKDSKNTYVLYTASWNSGSSSYDVQEVVTAQTVRGKFTAFSQNNGTVTVDGKVYNVAAQIGNNDKTYYTTNGLKDTVDLYLDTEGNVIGIKQYAAESKDLAVVLGFKSNGGYDPTDAAYSALLLLTDGTTKEVAMGSGNGVGNNPSSPNADYTPTGGVKIVIGDVVSYTDDGNSIFKLAKKNVNSGNSVGSKDLAITANLLVKKGANVIDVDTGVSNDEIYANSNTIYLIHDTTSGNKYTSYVGYANVPGIAGGSMSAYVDNGIASVVYVKGATITNQNADLIFVSNKSYSLGGDADLGNITSYKAVVDGKIVDVNVQTGITGTNGNIDNSLTGHMISNYTTNNKNVITAYTTATLDANGTGYFTATGIASSTNGVVKLGTKALAYTKDVKVFYANDKGALNDIGIDGIGEDANDIVFYTTNSDGVVTNIYVTYVK